jgi:replication factor A1
MSVETAAEQLVTSIESQTNISPDVEAIEADLEENMNHYQLNEDEAVRTVIGNLPVGDSDAIKSDYFGSNGDGDGQDGSENGLVDYGEIPELDEESWVDVRGKIVDMWEANSDKVAQVFLIADDNDQTLKVTVWQKSMDNNDWDHFETGEVLRFNNVVTDEYEGKYSVNVNSSTVVRDVDDPEFDPDATKEFEFTMQFVGYYEDSGLIQRCPEDGCSRVLDKGKCAEHGDVDGFEWDLRIKAIVDDGDLAAELILNQEQVESLTGMDLTEAQEIARDTLDRENVIEELSSHLMGKTLHGEATKMGKRLIANSVTLEEQSPEAEQALQEARAQA